MIDDHRVFDPNEKESMTEILPFEAVTYDPSRVSLNDVVVLPYDKIDEEARARYLERDPYNLVRISLPDIEEGEERYHKAAEMYRAWRDEGIFRRDERPGLHLYHQLFEYKGRGYTRKGFVARVRVEDPVSGDILGHEKTFRGPVADRLALLSAMRVHLGQIFLLYDDPEGELDSILNSCLDPGVPPRLQAIESSGEVHRLWTVGDRDVHAQVSRFFQSTPLTIADGHHRYQTAWEFMNRGGGPAHVMATLVSFQDAGLMVLPAHRLVLEKGLPPIDRIREILEPIVEFRPYPFGDPISRDRARQELEEDVRIESYRTPTFGLALGGENSFWLLKVRDPKQVVSHIAGKESSEWKSLGVVLLHRLVLEEGLGLDSSEIDAGGVVDYVREASRAVDEVIEGNAGACVLTSSTRVEQVRDLSQRRERMPHKSTDFFPKLLAGMVLDEFDGVRST